MAYILWHEYTVEYGRTVPNTIPSDRPPFVCNLEAPHATSQAEAVVEKALIGVCWAALALIFYAPLILYKVIEPDDLLDSEMVYNTAMGAIWRGDPSIAHGFLNGNVPIASLSRLTQPLTFLYALLPSFSAYVATDIIVRAVGAVGVWLLLSNIGTDRTFRHLLAALFAISLTNTTYALSVAGLPAAAFLLMQTGRLRLMLLLLIGWNSSIYLSGIFFLAAAPIFQRLIFQRDLSWGFALGWVAYAAGLLLGNVGLVWLTLTTSGPWHRAEWGPNYKLELPFPWRPVAQPVIGLFVIGALMGLRDSRVRWTVVIGVLIIAWYLIYHTPPVQALHSPIQFDRFYFLWPLLLVVLLGLAALRAHGAARRLLLPACLAGIVMSATPHEHVRQVGRVITGSGSGYPSMSGYYHTDWFRHSGLDASTPVMSVGIDPMSAPMNGVPSIDGYFPIYPLAYKHLFAEVLRDVQDDPFHFRRWGSRVYAIPTRPELLDFCAAKRMGAQFVVSAVPIQGLPLVRSGELKLYKTLCHTADSRS